MSLGALTTTFTPPAGCLPTGSLYSITTGTQFYYLKGLPYTSSCFPDGYNPNQQSYYTPGTACPASYTPGCTQYATAGTATETQVRCCPQIGTDVFTCKSTKELASYGNPWGSTLECASTITTGQTTSVIPVSATLAGTETAGNKTTINGMILAYAILIRYQKSDLAVTVTATNTAASSSDTSAASGSTSSGLKTGAAAGIGVAVGVVGLAIIAAVVYLFWSRRRKQLGEQPKQPDQGQPDTGMTEQQQHQHQRDPPKQPLWNAPASPSVYAGSRASTYVSETTAFNPSGYNAAQFSAAGAPAPAHTAPAELYSTSHVHEMSGEPMPPPIEMDATSHATHH